MIGMVCLFSKLRKRRDIMEKERQGKNIVIAVLLVTVLCMSVAFAAMGANLNVNGTVNLPNAQWDVGFTSATLVNGSIGDQPTISSTNNTVTYEVDLTEGATYEFNAVISNNGTYDAKLITYEVSDIPAALAGIVTYEVTELPVDTTVVSAKANNIPGQVTINVKITMGAIDTKEKLEAVQANTTFELTILAEFEQA